MKNLFLVFFLFASASFAQSGASLMPWSFPQFLDANGHPLAGGKVCTYYAGTNTPLATYTDFSGTVQNTNPVVLNAGGYAPIWMLSDQYKVVVMTAGSDNTCSTGTIVYSQDNIEPAGTAVLASSTGLAINAASFNFSPQTPGGTLASGTPATVTLTPCPAGVAGSDTAHYLEISGGSGSAEPVLITGGSCTSGLTTGTIVFTPANSHSGSWTVSTATGGIQEGTCSANSAGQQVYVPAGTYAMNANLSFCGHAAGYLVVEVGVTMTGSGTLPTNTSPGLTVDDRRQNTVASNLSWSNEQWRGQIPGRDYEFMSIILGDLDLRAFDGTPRGTIESTGSAFTVGWATPDNAHCGGCTNPLSQQNGINVEIEQMNTLSAGVGISVNSAPGIDNANGVWGLNVLMGNNKKLTSGMTTGMLGIEINISQDQFATDSPTVGVGTQSVGVMTTESSPLANHRVTAAYAAISSGVENFHNGLVLQSAPGGAHSMDKGVVMSGPIAIPIDLRSVTTETSGDILLGSTITHAISFNNSVAAAMPAMFASGDALVLRSLRSTGGQISFQSSAGVALGNFVEAGGFQATSQTVAQLATNPNTAAGYIWFASDGNPGTNPCTGGGAGAVAIREGGNFKCL